MATWIFGYGSLIWRPAFPYVERRPALLGGWVRRFWQHSTDHRGVPGAPGRVVTLVQEPGGGCWGRAYRIAPEHEEPILRQLDVREQGGYERRVEVLRLDPPAGATVTGLLYVGTSANPHFAGPAPLETIAEQVRTAAGPSGANVEYVLELARALRQMGAEDGHVFALAKLIDPRGSTSHSDTAAKVRSGQSGSKS